MGEASLLHINSGVCGDLGAGEGVASSLRMHAISDAHVCTNADLQFGADGELTGSYASSRWSGSCITLRTTPQSIVKG